METRGQRLAEPGSVGGGFAVPLGRGFPEEHVLHLGTSVQGAARVRLSGCDGRSFGRRAPREQDGDDRGREEGGDQEDGAG